jgi:hypothetical protein
MPTNAMPLSSSRKNAGIVSANHPGISRQFGGIRVGRYGEIDLPIGLSVGRQTLEAVEAVNFSRAPAGGMARLRPR